MSKCVFCNEDGNKRWVRGDNMFPVCERHLKCMHEGCIIDILDAVVDVAKKIEKLENNGVVKKVIDYIVIRGKINSIGEIINSKLKEGYILYGDLFHTGNRITIGYDQRYGTTEFTEEMAQALIKLG